jgi:hypothetical protein
MDNDRRYYFGKSMDGTFKPGDYLRIQLTDISELRLGDIVVFQTINKKGKREDLVHRIMKKSVLATRGDSNLASDETLISKENYLGQVIACYRNGKRCAMKDGWQGFFSAQIKHTELVILSILKFVLKKPYRMIKRTGLVKRMWNPNIERIYFKTPDGQLIKYIHNGRTVASYWEESNLWWYRRPYDFIIGPKLKK